MNEAMFAQQKEKFKKIKGNLKQQFKNLFKKDWDAQL